MTPSVAEVFRDEWTRLVAILVRDLGDPALAEDVAQEAFEEATARWPTVGTPDRPGAWLLTTARRRAIDRIRRDQRFTAMIPMLLRGTGGPTGSGDVVAEGSGGTTDHPALDEQLALVVGCCHPALAPEAQVALTLRLVVGLSTDQIARAFLVGHETMTRRISRAKEKIRVAGIGFRTPTIDTLEDRIAAVRAVVSSIFTEGHTSTSSVELIRGDLCDEAIWLGELLVRLMPDDPESMGLLALMLLVDSRRDARIDSSGEVVMLADQDRSRWNRRRIDHGIEVLGRAHRFGRIGPFQIHATIALRHATSPSFDETDWASIVRLYDIALRHQPTRIVALNRAIAISRSDGPAAGLRAMDDLVADDRLSGDVCRSPYLHAARAELLAESGRYEDALVTFDLAVDCSANEAERRHLRRRRDAVAATRR